ncbi:UMF1 family MFS transporter [Geothermobacter ehrlichii]|uniref:UMF1 family MFS transporter n=1 Tax=Geothermobacter ehrlichii TaxID=213224 RepID=A0A5D3WN14_9BACT|nr:MFS transporter [Geothermobacter ehrlichii]TYO99605.1 UMF1 family MFS transporter [Geothermobacter ehrlichii]
MNEAGQKKQRQAWCLYDWANSGFSTVVLTAVFPVWFASLLPADGVILPGTKEPVSATVLWGYLVSASLLLIVLFAPQLGRWADRRGRQRELFRFFVLLGSLATMGLALPVPPHWPAAALLFCIANLGFAAGTIFYNAFLPVLAEGDRLDRLSAQGFAVGYVGGGLALMLVFALVQGALPIGLDNASATRLGLLLTGAWWLLFSLPALSWMPAIPPRLNMPAAGFLTVYRDLRNHPHLLRFLFAFLLYNDGVQTMVVISALFARQELGMSQQAILGCFLLIQFLALPGTLLCGRLAEMIGPRPALFVIIAVFALATLWAVFMRHSWEFWLLGVMVALVLGGIQALSRSLFARLVPAEKTAEFFGFFAVSNKLAAICGPFAFALVNQLTGSVRLAILSQLLFFLLGAALLLSVDIRQGELLAKTKQ